MSNSNGKEVPAAFVLVDGINYTAVATAIPSSTGLDRPTHTVSNEFVSIPEARDLTWEDDFFEDEDVVAVFDMDYETMESFHTKVGWVWLSATILYSPLFTAAMLGLAPCYLRKNVQWCVNAQHVAITRDGIRFVRDRRRTCWGLPCTDTGKSSKTIPFDKITDCDLEEPAGNTCLCIENVLSTVNIDTASSGHGRHELQIAGLKDPHAFKKLVWAMKRSRGNGMASVPAALEMVERMSDNANVSTLLREIRDELKEHNTLLQSMKSVSATSAAAQTGNSGVQCIRGHLVDTNLPCGTCKTTAQAAPGDSAVAAGITQSAPQSVMTQVQYQQPPAPAPSAAAAAPVPLSEADSSSSSRQVLDHQQVLRHQQQRLLLLRHAAKCQHDDGRCPVTPHCPGMKRLWKHIAECKDQKCLVPHCVSSRYLVSHYHRCKDVRCPVCGPVREAIHRSDEKQKQMQALKQQHQQAVQQMLGSSGTQAPVPTSGSLTQAAQAGSAPTVTPVEPERLFNLHVL